MIQSPRTWSETECAMKVFDDLLLVARSVSHVNYVALDITKRSSAFATRYSNQYACHTAHCAYEQESVVQEIYDLGNDALRDATTKENSNLNWATTLDFVKSSVVVIPNSGFSVPVIWPGSSENL
eukprot:IDg18854t1